MNFNKKNIWDNTKNKLNTVVKLIYLQIKHRQSKFPRFSTLVLSSKTELLDLIFKQFFEILGNEIVPAKSMWQIFVLEKIDLSIYVAFEVTVKNTMFKTRNHGLQFKLKRLSLSGLALIQSLKNGVCQRCLLEHSLPLVTRRKIYVLETLPVFITNFQGF